jgi:hypothetical protein
MSITRKLPGESQRDNQGKIPFYKARVIYSSERVQWLETNHPEHKLVFLIGRTYLYWCPNCQTDVWQEEVNNRGVRNCPFCLGRILALSPGDRVRIHYRFGRDLAWAEWWGQRILE